MLTRNPPAAATSIDAVRDAVLEDEAATSALLHKVFGGAPRQRSRLEIALTKLATHFGEEVRRLGRIPEPQAIAELEAREFADCLELALEDTFEYLMRGFTNDESRSSRIDYWLNKIEWSVASLNRLFEDPPLLRIGDLHNINMTALALARIENPDLLCYVIPPSRIGTIKTHLLMLSDDINVVKRMIQESKNKPRRGRRQGSKKYPGLHHLVENLEYFTLSAGGQGFGTPTTKPPKGRIIQALDWLRRYLENTPEWKSFTKLLPPPGQHPVAIYHRAIRDARTLVASERKIENP